MADDSITVTREETEKLLAEIASIRKRMATDGIVESDASVLPKRERAAEN